MIVDKVEDKNPKGPEGWTPLHYAAHFGFSKIYKLIFENIEDKNPKDELGCTPIDRANSSRHDTKNIITFLEGTFNEPIKKVILRLNPKTQEKENCMLM